MKTAKKAMLLTVCALVLVAATVMGTMAYLTAGDSVTNTFVAGKLLEKKDDFFLKEKTAVPAGDGNYNLQLPLVQENKYTVIPGKNLPKDPFVSVKVKANGYLFLEVINCLPETMTFAIDDTQWIELKDDDGNPVLKDEHPIYTRKAGKIATASVAETLNILKDQQVVVSPALDVNSLSTADDVPAKTLSFNAYLIQADAEGFEDAFDAWTALVAEMAKP